MPSRLMLQLLAVVVLLTVSIAAQTKYGAGVTLQEETEFSLLQSQPNILEGKAVRVEAAITSVCATTPCRWIGISGTRGSTYGQNVFVRIEAGKMEFSKSLVGRRVTIEGVVASVARDPDPEAKVAVAEFNQENPGAPAFWQLKVTGAVVR